MDVDIVPDGNRILHVTRKEYVVLRVAVGSFVDLCEANPELFTGHDNIIALVGVASKMYNQLKGTVGVLDVQVQDEAVQTPDGGGSIRL